MAGLRASEWLGGDLANIDVEGISIFHHDIDHNPTATDIPLKYCDILYTQFGKGASKYVVAFAVSHIQPDTEKIQIMVYRRWGNVTLWSSITTTV